MDIIEIVLAVMTAALLLAARQARRLGNEKRDVAILGAGGALFGAGAAGAVLF